MAPQAEPGSPSAIATAVRQARERLGLSQGAVAEAMGWKAAETVSSIERGQRQLKAVEVAQLATILRVGLDTLLGVLPFSPPALVLWRTSDGCPHADVSQRLQREGALVERATRYALVLDWANEPPPRELPQFPLHPARASASAARSVAAEVSVQLNLGGRPARTLLETLEVSYGVKVFFDALEHDNDGSAACALGAFGAAVLLSRGEPPWRRSFSLAHELYHLVTWEAVRPLWEAEAGEGEPPWYSKLEAQANAFASALLLPERDLLECVHARARSGQLKAADLAGIALDFGVSMDAIAIRLSVLGAISEPDKDRVLDQEASFKQAWQVASRDKWSQPTSAFTERYVSLVRAAYQRGEIGRAKAAECLEVPIGELSRYGFDQQFDDSAALTVA